MQSLREAAGQDLQWKRVKWWKREFALRSGEGQQRPVQGHFSTW